MQSVCSIYKHLFVLLLCTVHEILKLSYIYLTICILKILLIKFPSTPRSALHSTYWKVGSSLTGYYNLWQETELQLAPDEFIRV